MREIIIHRKKIPMRSFDYLKYEIIREVRIKFLKLDSIILNFKIKNEDEPT